MTETATASKQLLLGTSNPAKIASFKKYLVHPKLKLLTLKDFAIIDEPLEIGKTYEENALQKAQFYAKKTEYWTLADDGGFEVDALNSRPGIESNRWLGPLASDQDKIDQIIRLLEGTKESGRTAKLITTIVVFFPELRDHISVSASIEGIVPERPSPIVIPKFPYRSLMFFPKLGKFMSELSEEEIEQHDHRGIAVKELLKKIEPFLD